MVTFSRLDSTSATSVPFSGISNGWMMGNIEDDDEEDPPLGDSPGDTTLVGDSLPSSKLFAARAATAEAFSLSSALILQPAWGSGTQLPRMELIWSSDTGDRGTSVVPRTVLMLVWIGGRGLVKFSSSAKYSVVWI